MTDGVVAVLVDPRIQGRVVIVSDLVLLVDLSEDVWHWFDPRKMCLEVLVVFGGFDGLQSPSRPGWTL